MKKMIMAARVMSTLFRPIYYPTVCFVIMFTLSSLSLLPWFYRAVVLGIVFVFTYAMPQLLILLYCYLMHLSRMELRQRHRRFVPYGIGIVCYLTCMHLLQALHVPGYLTSVVATSLAMQCICTLVNVWYKVSLHAAGSGGVIGALLAYSLVFQFNPLWWLCLALLANGLVGSSRMLLRQHTLGQVMWGTGIGIVVSFVTIVYLTAV